MAPPAITTYSPWGGQNMVIPGYDPTFGLMVNYARNEKEYVFNKYVTRKGVKLIRGYYPNFYAADLVRMQYPLLGNDMAWPWGQPRPLRFGNRQRFTNVNYELKAWTEPGFIADIEEAQNQWDLKKMEVNRCANKCLTFETAYTIAKITDTNNWTSTNFGTATATSGSGFWSTGTAANPVIMKSLNYAREQILLQTIGKVKQQDLKLVIGPQLATKISQTEEIHSYLQQQVGSYEVLTGEKPDSRENWMLPNPLYGYELMIEPSVYTTSPESVVTADTLSFILDKNYAFIVARPGSINSEMGGGADFSTVHIAELNEFQYSTYEEYVKRDKGTIVAVDLSFETILAAPQSGFLFTNTLS